MVVGNFVPGGRSAAAEGLHSFGRFGKSPRTLQEVNSPKIRLIGGHPLDASSCDVVSCSRFVQPQWQLLAANNSSNGSEPQTEECLDGWVFDRSEFQTTTVSEVTVVPHPSVTRLHVTRL